jgi:hypothetical protein
MASVDGVAAPDEEANPYSRNAAESEESWSRRLENAYQAVRGNRGEVLKIYAAIVQTPDVENDYWAYEQSVLPDFFHDPERFNLPEVHDSDPALAKLWEKDWQFYRTQDMDVKLEKWFAQPFEGWKLLYKIAANGKFYYIKGHLSEVLQGPDSRPRYIQLLLTIEFDTSREDWLKALRENPSLIVPDIVLMAATEGLEGRIPRLGRRLARSMRLRRAGGVSPKPGAGGGNPEPPPPPPPPKEPPPPPPPKEPPPPPRPGMTYPNGIPKEEGARLTQDARSHFKFKKGGNVAVAETDIEGRAPEVLYGVSGEASPGTTVPTPTNPLFKTKPSGAMRRDTDAEYKILEYLAKDLPPDAKGTISLYTEIAPCRSCGPVIDEFKRKFPGINLIVTHGD